MSKFNIFCLITMLSLMGCTTVHYMETETPAGTVPPPPQVDRPLYSPEQNAFRPSVPPVVAASESPQVTDFAASMQAPPRRNTGTVERFRLAYANMKKPRIAVYFNRSLSDEVREWAADSRLAISDSFTATKTVGGKTVERYDVSGETAIAREYQTENGYRQGPGERWMWAFEEGFTRPFLDSGTRIVDRASILRLAAATERDRNPHGAVEVKTVEMNALKGYADIFIEILISRSPGALYGYDFRASAKEVSTGMVIANVTSFNWSGDERRQRRVVATSHGYQVEETVSIPPLGEIASDLALDLMNAMAGYAKG